MRHLIIAVLICFLYGCSATTGNMKLETNKQKISDQMSVLTNKAEVRQKFGTPNLTFYKNNVQFYEYKNISGHGRYWWLIPVAGLFIPIFQDNYTFTENNLFIGFDKADKIIEWNVVQSGGTFN